MGTDELLKRIGIRISYIRKLRKLDQEELATKVGITRSYMSKVESANGIDGVPLSLYIRIAEALEVEAWKIFRIDE